MRSLKTLKQTRLALLVARKLAEIGITYQKGTRFALLSLSPGYQQKAAGAWAFELCVMRPGDTEFRPSGVGSPDRASDLRVSSKLVRGSDGLHFNGSVYFAD